MENNSEQNLSDQIGQTLPQGTQTLGKHTNPSIAAVSQLYPRKKLEKVNGEEKPLTLYFTQNVSNVVDNDNDTRATYPEEDPIFWTKSDVRVIGNSVLIKKTSDTIFIKASKVLKVPAKGLDLLVGAMEAALKPLSKDENGEYVYEGITEPTSYLNTNSSEFWDSSQFCYKVYWLKFRAFIAEYKNGNKLSFRMMNEVAEKSKVYKSGVLVWGGPSSNVGVDTFIGMLDVFRSMQTHTQAAPSV